MVKIFVGNLNPESKASDLRKKFEAFGKVTECDVVNNFGFVHMEKESEAEAAIAGLQNAFLDGVKINVERSHGKRGGGPGPARRRNDGRYRDYPTDRGQRGQPPPRYMNSGPPPPRMGRYGPAWNDGYSGPYGPPPRSSSRDIHQLTVGSRQGRWLEVQVESLRRHPMVPGTADLPLQNPSLLSETTPQSLLPRGPVMMGMGIMIGTESHHPLLGHHEKETIMTRTEATAVGLMMTTEIVTEEYQIMILATTTVIMITAWTADLPPRQDQGTTMVAHKQETYREIKCEATANHVGENRLHLLLVICSSFASTYDFTLGGTVGEPSDIKLRTSSFVIGIKVKKV
ncbi:unnamed protein product [Trichobilharzia szidati]|nr:unnamed protein product [Trichobilharzia szidati]